MTELEYIRNKYKNKSFIEIGATTLVKVIEWITGGLKDGQTDVRKAIGRISEKGFIKFLDEGVILVKPDSAFTYPRVYPFKFRDDDKLELSIMINNPYSTNAVHPLETLCRVEVGLDTKYRVIESSYKEQLAIDHIAVELQGNKLGVTELMPIIREVSEEFPDLQPDTHEWKLKVSETYFNVIIKAQIISCLGVHAYLTLLQKEILITRITQEKELKKGSSSVPKRSKRNPFYRYVVELPPGYKPRKFDFNWIKSHWERSGCTVTYWVLPENAEKLAKRKGGTVTNQTRGNRIAIRIPLAPTICHRRRGDMDETNFGTKEYK